MQNRNGQKGLTGGKWTSETEGPDGDGFGKHNGKRNRLNMEMVRDIFLCGCNYILWSLPLFFLLTILYRIKRPPKFVFRKLLHITAFSGVVFMNESANGLFDVVICLVIGAVAIYLMLSVLEKFSFYGDFFSEKSPHEVKRNFFGFFLTAAVLGSVCYFFGNSMDLSLVILLWGFGDAFAALIGIPYGKHKLSVGNQNKSVEGSIAFVAAAVIVSIVYLWFRMPDALGEWRNILGLVIVAVGAALAEVFSKEKWDNIFVPVVAAVGILIFKI